MPPLLSEEAINLPESAAKHESSETVATEDEPIPRSDERIDQAIDELRRDISEIKNQVFPLRIDIARSSSAVIRTVILAGIVVVLALMFGGGGFHRVLQSSMDGVNESEKSTSGSMTALNAEIEQLRVTIKNLKDRLDRQAVRPVNAESSAAAPDCAKLPPDIKTVTVDFSIQFPVGSASISPATEATLDSIANMLALASDRCVLIEGYADATGKEDKNMALSKERANSVANYIAEKASIPRNRLVPLGRGSSSPATGADPRDPQNRRVVFKIVSG